MDYLKSGLNFTDTIKNIVHWIHKALENKQKRRFRGFTPSELTQGLAKLAVNDSNKAKVIFMYTCVCMPVCLFVYFQQN